MVIMPLMSKARWFALGSLTVCLSGATVSACGNDDGRPSSLVSSNGEPGHSGGSGGHGGRNTTAGEAGQTGGEAGSSVGNDGGAAGEIGSAATPLAAFPEELQVDVGCGAATEPTELLVRNDGFLPLIISSAKTSAGYEVKTELPLEIAALTSVGLQISASPPKTTSSVGDMSTGTLTFTTNEANSPSHEVRLATTVFGGQFEFTDGDGARLTGALPLTYLSSDLCPDFVKYRVHNTGNLAFTLFGPTFPTHLGGTATGTNGQAVLPGAYVELEVSGNSAPDGACSGSGELTFTAEGSLCNAVPKLSVSWPANVATSGCSCIAAQ